MTELVIKFKEQKNVSVEESACLSVCLDSCLDIVNTNLQVFDSDLNM